MQGEDIDSSDEEWAAAYAAMDRIAQLGWRNRRIGGDGPAEHLLRDVFQAADAVHADAMSEMEGSRQSAGGHGAANEIGTEVGSVSESSDEGWSPTTSISVDQAGGP